LFIEICGLKAFMPQVTIERRLKMKKFKSSVLAAAIVAVFIATGTVEAGPKGPTIVDVAIELNSDTNSPYFGAFDTLIAAVLAADPIVVGTLSGNGQFTVFAPTDDAFAELELDESSVGNLPQDFLTDVLLYHVARGRRDSGDVLDSDRIRTLEGSFLLQDGGVLTDNLGLESTIIVVDVPAANGIIHAIDSVVLPYAP
jgi:uncharacterized surface protein with fasciclin (FAS1) repeats